MKVSVLAERAGTTAKAVRFYEAEGVLPAPTRAVNGYREYTEDDLCRLRLIVTLRSLGIVLSESGRLAELCSTGRCDAMAVDLTQRLADRRREIRATITELRHLDRELTRLETSLAIGAQTGTYQISSCADDTAGELIQLSSKEK